MVIYSPPPAVFGGDSPDGKAGFVRWGEANPAAIAVVLTHLRTALAHSEKLESK